MKKLTPTPELRLTFTPPTKSVTINNQEQATNYLRTIWDTDLLNVQEQVYVVFLDNAHQVICWRCLHTGGISSTIVDVKLVFSLACGCLASSILVAHNHPSGKLIPPQSDIKITEKLLKAGETMEITLIDHLILTSKGSHSIVDRTKIYE